MPLPEGDNNIGSVNVAAILPGTGATSLGKAEDAAHASGDVGVMALSVRKDTAAATSGTDGDYQPVITDASGRMHVAVGNITQGAGAVAATTQRVTLASDDPAVDSLSVLDDWDETDRCKVNLIAGQAGVQGGSGTTNALTQRVVLATDVALPAGNNNIGDVDVASVAPVGTIYHNKTTVTTAGTRVVLASSRALTAGVYIKALSTNTGLIYVGTSTVSSTNGIQLSAKEQIWIPISNLNTINIDSSVNGEGVTYLGW